MGVLDDINGVGTAATQTLTVGSNSTTTPGAGTATDGTGAVETKPTREELMAKWDEAHPAPVRTEVKEPEYSHNYDYAKLLQQYHKGVQVDPKAEKRQRLNESIGAIGTALGSLINAVGTSKGANNMDLDVEHGYAESSRRRYEQTLAKQKADFEKYMALQLKAAQMENDDNMKKLSMYNTAQQRADSAYQSAIGRHEANRRAQEALYQKDQEDEATATWRQEQGKREDKRIENDNNYHEGMLGIQNKKVNLEGRRVALAEKQDAREGGEQDYNVQVVGGMKRKKAMDKVTVSSCVQRMYDEGCISKQDYNNFKLNLADPGITLEIGAKTKKGREILQNEYGFK